MENFQHVNNPGSLPFCSSTFHEPIQQPVSFIHPWNGYSHMVQNQSPTNPGTYPQQVQSTCLFPNGQNGYGYYSNASCYGATVHMNGQTDSFFYQQQAQQFSQMQMANLSIPPVEMVQHLKTNLDALLSHVLHLKQIQCRLPIGCGWTQQNQEKLKDFDRRLQLHESELNSALQQFPENPELHGIFKTFSQMQISIISMKLDALSSQLAQWKAEQCRLSIGCCWTLQNHQEKLDELDRDFELFGSKLKIALQRFPVNEELKGILETFLKESFVVSRQPPSVIFRVDGKINRETAQGAFQVQTRFLGWRSFFPENPSIDTTVSCQLVNAEETIGTNNAKNVSPKEFELTAWDGWKSNPTLAFHRREDNSCFSTKPVTWFISKDPKKNEAVKCTYRPDVLDIRYYLFFKISVRFTNLFGYELSISPTLFSLPFAIVVNQRWDVEAHLFLERSFLCGDCCLQNIKGKQNWTEKTAETRSMLDALEMKWQAILEKHTKTVEVPRSFSLHSRQHLSDLLKPSSEGRVSLEAILEPCECDSGGKRKAKLGKYGKTNTEKIPFYEWFFQLADIVSRNSTWLKLWKENVIYGFCSKAKAENILTFCGNTNLLVIRFSDREPATIKFSIVKTSNGQKELMHYFYGPEFKLNEKDL